MIEFPYYLASEEGWAEFVAEEDKEEPQFKLLDVHDVGRGATAIHTLFWVTAYEITQEYGGPEEGGWWYVTGEPMDSFLVRTLKDAREAYTRLSIKYPKESNGRPYHSVLYNGGDYRIHLERHEPRSFPTEAPRYE